MITNFYRHRGKVSCEIGHGYDVHRFTEDDSIVLGSVNIPHSQGVDAHSDGDVLIHTVVLLEPNAS